MRLTMESKTKKLTLGILVAGGLAVGGMVAAQGPPPGDGYGYGRGPCGQGGPGMRDGRGRGQDGPGYGMRDGRGRGPRGDWGGPRDEFGYGGPRGERGFGGPRGGQGFGGPRGDFMPPPPPFESHDTDGDGKLSPAEAEVIPPVRDMGFKAFDKDNDGYLTREELPPPPRGQGMRPPRFEDADKDGDGKLSKEEAASIPPVMHRGFEAWDTDNDGFLTREELPPPPHAGGPGRDRGAFAAPDRRGPPPHERGGWQGPPQADGALGPDAPRPGRNFEALDANGDGVIDRSEFEARGRGDGAGPRGPRPDRPRYELPPHLY